MILHKSLNKKKGAGYSFVSGLSSALVPAAVQSILLTLFMAVLPAVQLSSLKKTYDEPNNPQKITDVLKYLILGEGENSFIIIAVVAIMSVLVGVLLFRFSADKKTVNVYYSLGIKRTSLYLTKYFAGLILLTVSVIIPIVLCYLVNVAYLGLSVQISVTLLYFFFGLCFLSLLCFSVTAAVFSCVGTVSESIVHSVGLLSGVTVFLFALQRLAEVFLTSAAFNFRFVKFTDPSIFSSENASLITLFAYINPLLFFLKPLSNYGQLNIKEGETILANEQKWTFPDFAALMPWLLVIAAVAALGCILFSKRKAEKCGFLDTNKILSNFFIFELCLFAITLLLPELKWASDNSEKKFIVAACFCLALAAYIACEIFIKRNFKLILKTFYKFPAHLAVVAILVGIMSVGLSGYGNYFPDVKKVSSVAVTLPADMRSLVIRDDSSGEYYHDIIKLPLSHNVLLELPEMTDSADIEKAMSVHKKFIEKDDAKAKNFVSVGVRYKLKSGREEMRTYKITDMSVLKECLSLYETKACRAALKELLTTEYKYSPNTTNWFEALKMMMTHEYAIVEAYTPSLSESRTLNLSEEEFKSLKASILSDLTAKSAEDYFNTERKQLGVISFSFNSDKFYSYEEGVTGIYSEAVTGAEQNIANENVDPETGEVISTEGGENEKMSAVHKVSTSYGMSDKYLVYVDEGMTSTLACLKTIGCENCFSSEKQVRSISFRKCDYYSFDEASPLLDFAAYDETDSLSWEFENVKGLDELIGNFTENKITDPAKLAELEGLMKLHYYTYNSGYWCAVIYTDDTVTVKYLPSASAPAYVTGFNYTLSGDID